MTIIMEMKKMLMDVGKKLKETIIDNKKYKKSTFNFEKLLILRKKSKVSITKAENNTKVVKTKDSTIEIEKSKTEKIPPTDVKSDSKKTETKKVSTTDVENGQKKSRKRNEFICFFFLYYFIAGQLFAPISLMVFLFKDKDDVEGNIILHIFDIIVYPIEAVMKPLHNYMTFKNTKSITIMFMTLLCGVIILSSVVELFRRKRCVTIIFLLLASFAVGHEIAWHFTPDLGLVIGQLTCLVLIQLIWFSMPWEIRFDKTSIYILSESCLFFLLNVYFLYYRNLEFFLAIFTHISAFYSICWLILHVQLLRHFGENHWFGSVSLYSNMITLYIKMQLMQSYYVNPN